MYFLLLPSWISFSEPHRFPEQFSFFLWFNADLTSAFILPNKTPNPLNNSLVKMFEDESTTTAPDLSGVTSSSNVATKDIRLFKVGQIIRRTKKKKYKLIKDLSYYANARTTKDSWS